MIITVLGLTAYICLFSFPIFSIALFKKWMGVWWLLWFVSALISICILVLVPFGTYEDIENDAAFFFMMFAAIGLLGNVLSWLMHRYRDIIEKFIPNIFFRVFIIWIAPSLLTASYLVSL